MLITDHLLPTIFIRFVYGTILLLLEYIFNEAILNFILFFFFLYGIKIKISKC